MGRNSPSPSFLKCVLGIELVEETQHCVVTIGQFHCGGSSLWTLKSVAKATWFEERQFCFTFLLKKRAGNCGMYRQLLESYDFNRNRLR